MTTFLMLSATASTMTRQLNLLKRLNPAPEKVDELVASLMKPHCRLLNVKESNRFLPAKGYSLDGLNIKGKVGLEKIVRSVRNYLDESFNAASEDHPRMNLLMYGPPGTGKTEFVKYLGDELTNQDRIAALKEECANKKDGAKTAAIGFGV